VKKIVVTESGADCSHIAYVYHSVNAECADGEIEFHLGFYFDEVRLSLSFNEAFLDKIKKCVASAVADIICISYKYDFLSKNLALTKYSDYDRELLLSALISADLKEEKKFLLRRLSFDDIICINGFYNFRMAEERAKWSQIISIMPNNFLPYEFERFIGFLLEGENKKVYVKDSEVFDDRYKKLRRSRLIGNYPEFSFLREIILSGADSICCLTPVNGDDGVFLKKYYPSKVFFS